MLTKYGQFYADWTDHLGKRKRKAFPTPKQAEAHQKRARLEAATKKARASERSAKSAKRGSRRTPKQKTAA